MGDESGMGSIADRVLFENEQVRIWEMDLQPGESSQEHHHDNDYIVILIAGDRVGVRPAPGSKDDHEGYHEAEVTPGRTAFIPAGGTETAINVGTVPYKDIEIELL